jgi:hypothetical protein
LAYDNGDSNFHILEAFTLKPTVIHDRPEVLLFPLFRHLVVAVHELVQEATKVVQDFFLTKLKR